MSGLLGVPKGMLPPSKCVFFFFFFFFFWGGGGLHPGPLSSFANGINILICHVGLQFIFCRRWQVLYASLCSHAPVCDYPALQQ